MAPDVETAKALIDTASACHVTCSIAENYRFIPKFQDPAEAARNMGKLGSFTVRASSLLEPENSWYSTGWRENPLYRGGPLLDGGVHYAAATRMFLQGDSRAVSATAATHSAQKHLPPIDTVNAIIKTRSGASGTVQISIGSRLDAFEWYFGYEKGTVKLSGERVMVVPVNGTPTIRDYEPCSGVSEEIMAWAEGISLGVQNPAQSLWEAVADVEFLEMMFLSG